MTGIFILIGLALAMLVFVFTRKTSQSVPSTGARPRPAPNPPVPQPAPKMTSVDALTGEPLSAFTEIISIDLGGKRRNVRVNKTTANIYRSSGLRSFKGPLRAMRGRRGVSIACYDDDGCLLEDVFEMYMYYEFFFGEDEGMFEQQFDGMADEWDEGFIGEGTDVQNEGVPTVDDADVRGLGDSGPDRDVEAAFAAEDADTASSADVAPAPAPEPSYGGGGGGYDSGGGGGGDSDSDGGGDSGDE